MTFLTSFFISPAYRFTAPGITNGVVASNIDTLPTGAIRQLTLGNGIQMVREYDTAGQLKSQQWGNDRTLYSYDGNGKDYRA